MVECERFLYSILVVGFHVQLEIIQNKNAKFFQNGANAVEFFFLVSGYFMARSIEKINSKEKPEIFLDSLYFLKNKIKSILPTHIASNVIMIIIILIVRKPQWDKTLLNGLPGLFLVQMAVVWNGSYVLAINNPEWYISTLLLGMLFIVPISLLLRKKMKLLFVVLLHVIFISLIAVIAGCITKCSLPDNFANDIRGWLEMCLGMFAFCLSNSIRNKEFNMAILLMLKIIEIICYIIPVILGFILLKEELLLIIMAFTAFCTFFALSITFADKGVVIKKFKG